MSRQLEQATEERETKRREALVKALEFELAGAIEFMGGEFSGFAMKYDEFSVLMTYKAVFEGTRRVAFVGGDSMITCLCKAANMAKNNKLRWRTDRYSPSET